MDDRKNSQNMGKNIGKNIGKHNKTIGLDNGLTRKIEKVTENQQKLENSVSINSLTSTNSSFSMKSKISSEEDSGGGSLEENHELIQILNGTATESSRNSSTQSFNLSLYQQMYQTIISENSCG